MTSRAGDRVAIVPGLASEQEVQTAVSFELAYVSVRAALGRMRGRRLERQAHPRLDLLGPSGSGLKMQPAVLDTEGGQIYGCQTYFVGEPRSAALRKVLVIADGSTGSIVGVLASDFLSAVSTAAVTAIATEALLGTRPASTAIVGTGKQAQMHARLLSAVFRPEKIDFVSREPSRGRAVAEEVGDLCPTPVGHVLEGADLRAYAAVVTATRSRVPVLKAGQVSDSAVVCAIGAHALGRSELDDTLLAATGTMVIDHAQQADETYGELAAYRRLRPQRANAVKELSEVLERGPDAESRGLRVFKSGGTGFETLAVGHAALQSSGRPAAG